MKLYSIEYTEFSNEPYAWVLGELALININLIVGKNATGKSRVLRTINGLAKIIDGSISPQNISSGRYIAVFKDNFEEISPPKLDITYSIDINNSKVIAEKLIFGDSVKLERGEGGRGRIYFEKNNSYIDVQIPENLSAVSSRRDSQQHSFFEQLHIWAQSVRLFEFNKDQKNEATNFEGKLTIESIINSQINDHFHSIVKIGKEHFRRDFTSAVIKDMKRIGYDITDFGLSPLSGVSSSIKMSNSPETLYINELGVDKKMLQNEISDGMLRALITLVHLHFITLQKNFGCVLIDDIGEGLDFDRATKLIEIIIELAEKSYFQLVMSTNDRFVMNNVSLDYWSVLHRNKGKISVFSKRNSPDVFKNFEEYGFNNFDLFAKGFYSKKDFELIK